MPSKKPTRLRNPSSVLQAIDEEKASQRPGLQHGHAPCGGPAAYESQWLKYSPESCVLGMVGALHSFASMAAPSSTRSGQALRGNQPECDGTHWRVVLLEIEGTLLDSNEARAKAWVEALAEHGRRVLIDRVRRCMGMGGNVLMAQMIEVPTDSEEFVRLVTHQQTLFETKYLPFLRPFPLARALVQRFKDRGLGRIPLGHGPPEHIAFMVRIAKLDDLVDVTRAPIVALAPEDNPIRKTVEQTRLVADQSVLLCSSPHYVECAKRAGLISIALRCGGWTDAELDGALAIYDDPADLLQHYPQTRFAR